MVIMGTRIKLYMESGDDADDTMSVWYNCDGGNGMDGKLRNFCRCGGELYSGCSFHDNDKWNNLDRRCKSL